MNVPPPSGARLPKWVACAALFCLQPRFGGFGGRCRSATAALVFLLCSQAWGSDYGYNKQAERCMVHRPALAIQSSKEIEMLEANSNEAWRPVVGYEGIYSVSDYGKVRREKYAYGHLAGKILNGDWDRFGYHRVVLFRENQGGRGKERCSSHRLVLSAFVGPANGRQCNHKNGIKNDNRLENLEWVTSSENHRHAFDVLGKIVARGATHCHAKLNEDQVRSIRQRCANGEKQSSLAREFRLNHVTVGDIVRRKNWAWLA